MPQDPCMPCSESPVGVGSTCWKDQVTALLCPVWDISLGTHLPSGVLLGKLGLSGSDKATNCSGRGRAIEQRVRPSSKSAQGSHRPPRFFRDGVPGSPRVLGLTRHTPNWQAQT